MSTETITRDSASGSNPTLQTQHGQPPRRMQPPEPMDRADAERAVYYAKFDRAVATLSPDQADRVDLLSSYVGDAGTWHLRDVACQLVATVRDPDRPTPEPTKPASPPARPTISLKEKKLLFAFAKKVNDLDSTLAECIERLADRLETLETKNAIDAEVVTELERVVERVEAIETRGFRFVGKYQAPATYRTGDVVAYKDALWNCVQDAKVGDRPNTASHKWALMMSGGNE